MLMAAKVLGEAGRYRRYQICPSTGVKRGSSDISGGEAVSY